MVRDVFRTYSQALKYLATLAHVTAEKASGEDVKRELALEETEYWTTYALSCARSAGAFFENRETLLRQGEMALQKILLHCIDLGDLERATSAFKRSRTQ